MRATTRYSTPRAAACSSSAGIQPSESISDTLPRFGSASHHDRCRVPTTVPMMKKDKVISMRT